jgi:hypothetical protein
MECSNALDELRPQICSAVLLGRFCLSSSPSLGRPTIRNGPSAGARKISSPTSAPSTSTTATGRRPAILDHKVGLAGAPRRALHRRLCIYRITLVQVLPPFAVGYPDKGVHNWLPRLADHLGLRSVAVRAGFSVKNGVVTSKWFAEQVSLPVSAWGPPGAALLSPTSPSPPANSAPSPR